MLKKNVGHLSRASGRGPTTIVTLPVSTAAHNSKAILRVQSLSSCSFGQHSCLIQTVGHLGGPSGQVP